MPGHIHAAQFIMQPSRQPPPYCSSCTLCLPARSQSTLLWEEVRIDWRVLQQQAAASDRQHAPLSSFAAAAAWLAARLPRARRLVLLSCRSLPGSALQQVTNRPHKRGSCKPAAAHVHVKARAVGQASRQRRPARRLPPACSSSQAAWPARACWRRRCWVAAAASSQSCRCWEPARRWRRCPSRARWLPRVRSLPAFCGATPAVTLRGW
jgi:hypothetical protein